MPRRRSCLLPASRVGRPSIAAIAVVEAAAIVIAGAAAAPAIADATLVHHWPGEGTVEDAVGRADGRAIGVMTYDAGRVGRAFRFAAGSAIALPASVGDTIDRDFTIAFWCRFESPVASALLHQGPACDAVEWYRMESRPDGDLLCTMSDDRTGTLALLTREADLHDGAWHHVAWRRHANAHSVFVDGCLLVSPTSSRIGDVSVADDLMLGGPWCTTRGVDGSPFAGSIDEVRWYVGALSDAEIHALAQGPLSGDLTGDDVVDGADLAELLSAWGACGTCCAADLDGNGEVNGADLGVVLGTWTTG